ncbi:MAG: putative glutamine amidotransferase [Lysobacterales bacterium]|jgi:putative glutamine amidotransferase
MSIQNRPLVGVIADRRMIGDHAFHMAGEKYLEALLKGSGVYPVILPALSEDVDVEEILQDFDGLFLTGSPSNVEPHHYFGDPSKEGTWHDPERDVKAFALIPAAIKAAMPLFAVCRGFQEMNVAFGGTLHQLVHEVPGYGMHKEDPSASLDEMYGPSHGMNFVPGGFLETLTGVSTTQVNSLHSQAIDRIADDLIVEAIADDGLIEAFTVRNAPGYTLGIQWHPEWKVMESPVSLAIFKSFGDACRKHERNDVTSN